MRRVKKRTHDGAEVKAGLLYHAGKVSRAWTVCS
jgi:hypothetical protein